MDSDTSNARLAPERPVEEVSRARHIGSSLLWSQMGRVADIALGLVFSILVVRVLGPQEYAVYAVVWAVASVAALIASLGYGEALTRYVPTLRAHSEPDASALTRRLLGERVLISLLIAVALWMALVPLVALTRTPALYQLIGFVSAIVVTQGVLELFVAYYTATLRMRDYAAVRIVGQTISLGLALVLFLGVGNHVWVPLAAMLVGSVVSGVFYLWGAPQILTARAGAADLSAARRFGGYVWLTNLATWGLTSQVDVLLLAALLSDSTQISYYNVAMLLLGRLYAVLTGWTTVLMPATVDAYARAGNAGLARSFDMYMKVNLIMLLPPFVFVVGWASLLVTTLFGEAFAPATTLVIALAIFNLASIIAGANVCHPLLYVANRQRVLFWLRLIAGVLNIALDIVLIPPLGAAGAVLATSVSNLSTHLIEFVMLRRWVGAPYPVWFAVKLLGVSLLAILPAFILPDVGWIVLAIGGVLFAVIFFGVLGRVGLFSPQEYAIVSEVAPRLRTVLNWFVAA